MEFLGDAVLGFVVSRELFQRFPEYQEGELSKLRAHLVSARHLLRPARELEIGQYLRLGKGEERSGGRSKVALLVDALEAVIAALFLDAGLETAHRFIQQSILEPGLAEVHQGGSSTLPVMDYKSALQEAVHASGRSQPRYVLVKEEGPDHRKMFTMEAQVPAASQRRGRLCPSRGGQHEETGRAKSCTRGVGFSTIAKERSWGTGTLIHPASSPSIHERSPHRVTRRGCWSRSRRLPARSTQRAASRAA